MIDHLSLGIAQLDKSRRFYDASLGALGYRRLSDGGGALSYGAAEAMLWLLQTRGQSRPTRNRACMCHSGQTAAKPWTHSIAPRSITAARTTASPACARSTARATTRRS